MHSNMIETQIDRFEFETNALYRLKKINVDYFIAHQMHLKFLIQFCFEFRGEKMLSIPISYFIWCAWLTDFVFCRQPSAIHIEFVEVMKLNTHSCLKQLKWNIALENNNDDSK